MIVFSAPTCAPSPVTVGYWWKLASWGWAWDTRWGVFVTQAPVLILILNSGWIWATSPGSWFPPDASWSWLWGEWSVQTLPYCITVFININVDISVEGTLQLIEACHFHYDFSFLPTTFGNYCSISEDEETESQSGSVTCPKSPSGFSDRKGLWSVVKA